MGRKPLAGIAKEVRLVLRVTPDERASIEEAAAKAGKPASTWAREELLKLAAANAAKPATKAKRL